MKKLLIPILALLILAGFKAPQTRTITGVVADANDGNTIPGASIRILPSNKTTTTDAKGKFSIAISDADKSIIIAYLGYQTQTISITKENAYQIKLHPDNKMLEQVVIVGAGQQNEKKSVAMSAAPIPALQGRVAGLSIRGKNSSYQEPPNYNTEGYSAINENGFLKANKNPLSTFSIDVDAASYSNMRRFINNGSLPPKDAVRI